MDDREDYIQTRPARDYDRAEAVETDRPATVLENAMFELEAAQGELFESASMLARKLRGVMKRPYDPKEEALRTVDAPSKDTERHSALVRQLSSCSNRTRSTREIIEFINSQIEV